jgi:putative ABC transport system permease protein
MIFPFGRRRREALLREELDTYLRMAEEERLRRGSTPEAAKREARREFGNIGQVAEVTRETWGWSWVDRLTQDIRYALRGFRQNPGFVVAAVVTLAIGIGANTTVVTMENALLVKPYPFRDLGRLVRIWETRGIDESFDARFVSPGDARTIRERTAAVFDGLAEYRCRSANLNVDGLVESAFGCRISPGFFGLLGVVPERGRVFAEASAPGADRALVVSHEFWTSRLARSEQVIGMTVRLDGQNHTIVGVAPPGFAYPVPMQFWVPLLLTAEEQADRSKLSLEVIARLRPGVDLTRAGLVLRGIARDLGRDSPTTNAGRDVRAVELRKELYAYTLPLFGLLQAAAVLVLALVTANLVNLVSVRFLRREKEMLVRAALGAGRGRLAQFAIVEMLLLAGLAALLAVIAAVAAVHGLRTGISPEWTKWVPGWDRIQVDVGVLVLTVGITVIVACFLGTIVARRSTRLDLNRALKDAVPGSGSPQRATVRSALVVVQLTLAAVLLHGAIVTIRGFAGLARLYGGLDPASVVKLEIALSPSAYPDTSRIAGFYRRVFAVTASMPEVASAAAASNLPASSVDNPIVPFTIEGRPSAGRSEVPSAALVTVSAGYFGALGIPVVGGRLFPDDGAESRQPVAVISESMAARYWPHTSPGGSRIRIGDPGSASESVTVVGVVADVRQNWWNPPAAPTIYRPFLQAPAPSALLVAKTTADPARTISLLRDAIRRIDPDVGLQGVGTLASEVRDSLGLVRLLSWLMSGFGLVAAGLSAIGIYGVLSETLAVKTREICIRLALGAGRRDATAPVLRLVTRLALAALAIALPLSVGLGRLLRRLEFGLGSMDAPTMALVAAGVLIVVGVAAYLPARRMVRLEPMRTLRME